MWNEWPVLGPINTLKETPSEMPNHSQSHSLSLTHPEVQRIAGGEGASLVGHFLQLQRITFIKLNHRKRWICHQNKNWKWLSLLPVPMLYDVPVAGLNQQGFSPYRREGNVIPADMWHYSSPCCIPATANNWVQTSNINQPREDIDILLNIRHFETYS